MRELSIEQKAQRYDEALERAKQLSKELTVDDIVEQIFPELAESENERIRKALIKYYSFDKDGSSHALDNITPKQILDWLENQGKQKFADGTFVNVDDVREDFIQEVYRVLDADSTNDRANQIIDAFDNLPTVAIEKQGEQNPQIKLVFPKFRVGDIIQHIPLEKWDTTKKITHIDETGYYFDHSHQGDTVSRGFIGFLSENDYELVEQKSAWSKEDDMVLNLILDSIQREGVLEKKRKTDWLKSLKDRVLPQPMQEWSEEDKGMVTRIVESLSAYADKLQYEGFCHNSEVLYEQIDWLKSLRPQSTWKPSDEQILAIETVINVVGKDTLSGKHLIELLEQLKTL